MSMLLFFIYISCQGEAPVEDTTEKNIIEPADAEPSSDEIEVEPSGESPTDSGTLIDPNDVDSDGYDLEVDCDDQNPNIHPDAEEMCDSIDNNCDGIEENIASCIEDENELDNKDGTP